MESICKKLGSFVAISKLESLGMELYNYKNTPVDNGNEIVQTLFDSIPPSIKVIFVEL
jgi:hypothetical protein